MENRQSNTTNIFGGLAYDGPLDTMSMYPDSQRFIRLTQHSPDLQPGDAVFLFVNLHYIDDELHTFVPAKLYGHEQGVFRIEDGEVVNKQNFFNLGIRASEFEFGQSIQILIDTLSR